MTRVPSFLGAHQREIEEALDRLVPAEHTPPEAVHRAMRYTLLAPSKRIRGVLVFLSAEACGRTDRAGGFASAVELVHAASLILDDLPSMDNAPLRRGRAACHVEFGESTALLASFNLLALGFRRLAEAYEPSLCGQLTRLLSTAIGSEGLIGGQAEDLSAMESEVTFERLERIHRLKTGVLFSAAATAGAITAGAAPNEIAQLAAYAKNLGLAFQVIDDLLDVTGDPAETGKMIKQDAKKTTFLSFSGLEGARLLAAELCATADRALTPFGQRAARLRELSAFVAERRL